MISNKYINAIIATFTAIALFFTTIIYVNSKNITDEASNSSSNFNYVETIFNKEQVTEIDLEIDEDNWNYLLDNAINEEYINANITVNGTKYNNVGIRAKGNSSLSMIASDDSTDRYSFKVKFDEYVDGQTLDGLTKIALNNIMSDATYMKEYLSYDLLEKMGVPTPAFAFTNIKVNGKEWGLYFAVEVIEEEFIERNYGYLSGNLYKPEGNEIGVKDKNNEGIKPNMNDGDNMAPPNMGNPQTGNNLDNFQSGENKIPPNMSDNQNIDTNGNENLQDKGFRGGMICGGMGASNGGNLVYTDDNKESYSDIFKNNVFKSTTETDEDKVIEMIKNLNAGTNLEEYLNVDEILRYFAVNTFLVNLDSYASNMKHNYYLYERDGLFEIIPWDYNLSFGGFNIGTASKAINFPIDSPVTDSLENSPLIGKLLEVDKYKETYHKYLQETVDYVNDGTYENTINQVNSLISDYVKNDATAFYTYEEYIASLPELIKFGEDRAKSISSQLDGSQPSTSYGNIETTVNLTALGSQGGMKNMDKNMNFQKPTDANSTASSNIENNEFLENQVQGNKIQGAPMQGGQMPEPPIKDGQIPDAPRQDGQMQNNKIQNPNVPTEQSEVQMPSNNNNNNNNNNEEMNTNNRQQGFEKINTQSPFTAMNNTGTILTLFGYVTLLLIGIIFVSLFKRKRFKAK
ncbi:MAG: CotH kinase family protein [Clostridium sp.]|uniref:CotH kinase family protein n=1 Tax=Clostridium sp. TaxID=1506 RepID=UPI002A764200|nr:CotH kinase family protein [Clostridium sp.]MDY2629873.1 CotH kinase family protein [Clostridium sp.]